MPTDLTPETWAQIRQDYEHTQRPIAEICDEHGISSGTLHNRVRRWRWTPRRMPIPLEGPPALPPSMLFAAPPYSPPGETGAASAVAPPFMAADAPLPCSSPACSGGVGEGGALDNSAIVSSLQNALGRLLPAIDATVAQFAAGPMRPREMEQAARALASLTRTLRELNALLSQRQAATAAAGPYVPEDVDELRAELARRMRALIYEHTGETAGAEVPDETAAAATFEA